MFCHSPTWSLYEDSDESPMPSPSTSGSSAAIPQLKDTYKKVSVLARGAQGIVYAATDRGAGRAMGNGLVAIKRYIVDYDDGRTRGVPETIIREISMHRHLAQTWGLERPCPFVGIERIVHGPNSEICAAFEFCPYDLSSESFCRSLREVRNSAVFTATDVIKYILRASFQALDFLHKNNVIHRDIKLSNFLIGADGSVKLGDLGSAKRLSRCDPSARGNRSLTPAVRRTTLLYRSPETVLGFGASNYGSPADVWALGVVFSELMLTCSSDAPSVSVSQSKQGPQHLFPVTGELHLASAIIKLTGPLTGDESFLDNSTTTTASTKNIDDDNSNTEGFGEANNNDSSKRARTEPAFEGTMKVRFANKTSAEGLDLLQRMLTVEPNERITANESLHHPFLSTLSEESEAQVKAFMQKIGDERVASLLSKVQSRTTAHAFPESGGWGGIALGIEPNVAQPRTAFPIFNLGIPNQSEGVSSTAKSMRPVTLAFGEDDDDEVDDPFA